jgi:hypothetical protein
MAQEDAYSTEELVKLVAKTQQSFRPNRCTLLDYIQELSATTPKEINRMRGRELLVGYLIWANGENWFRP